MTNGKQKGASFERSVCVKLSLWVSKGESEDLYWRSSMSGGRSTVAARRGKRLAAQAGDISCIHPLGAPLTDKFYLECKSYKDLEFKGLITGKGHLVKFWCETLVQARNYGKLPLLIAHQNQQPTIVCLSAAGRNILALAGSERVTVPTLDLLIVLFEDLLKHGVVNNQRPASN